MTKQPDSTAFRDLRGVIEADLNRFSLSRPPLAELVRVKELLNHLQTIANSLVEPPPAQPQLPARPVIPAPPPIPELRISERYRQVSESTLSEIKKLRATIESGQSSKALRKQLVRLETHRIRQLHEILREESPPGYLERREDLKGQHKRHRREQQEALKVWDERCRALQRSWEESYNRWKLENPMSAIRQHAIDRLRKEFRRLQSGDVIYSVPVGQVPWQFLPPPEPGEAGLARTLGEIRRYCPHLSIDVSRLRFSYELHPTAVFIGLEEFSGYLAFTFEHTSKVLLECPVEGNAAYIFHSDWRDLSRLSKTTLLFSHRSKVGRVIHDPGGEWKGQIRRYLS